MCRWRVETERLRGIGEDNFASFYLEGRAESTMKNYRGVFRFVWSHAQEIGRIVFDWGEGEVAGLMVRIAKASAVVNMLFEAAGMEGPTKGEVLKMVKKAVMKKMNVEKEKPLEREGTKLADVEKMVEKIYLKMGNRASVMKRQMFMYIFDSDLFLFT